MQQAQTLTQPKDILGHPRGLFVLFFAEMWERFSYYGMRALLILYMTQYLFVEVREKGKLVWGYEFLSQFITSPTLQGFSSQIYGVYTGLVYLTPIFGGYIADRYWGHKRSVYLGGFLMAIGHFLMAVESLFFPALLFIILGNGLFKPNLVSQVGNLYPPEDPRKDRAFMIYYMGVNLGAFFSPLVCGTLGQKLGWHWGFGAAGVGMLVGLAVYHFGRHLLPVEAALKNADGTKIVRKNQPLTTEDKKKIGALIFLVAISTAFWSVYEQQGNTMQLWVDSKIDWHIGSFLVPSTWYQSLNPFFIFALVPLLTAMWAWMGKWEPNSVSKMAIGCIFTGLCFVLMYLAVDIVGAGNGSGSLWWPVVTVFLLTIGELYISPVGLSLASKLSPPQLISMMMGMMFLSSFLGGFLSGWIGSYYEIMGEKNFFMLLVVISFVAAVIFYVSKFALRRLVPADH